MKTSSFIILRSQAFKDSDLIVHAIDSSGCRRHFLARGAVRSKKRFGGGVLEAMNHASLSYDDRKKKDEFVPLTEALLLNGFENLRKDYDLLRRGIDIVLMAFKITLPGDENPELYNLIGHALLSLQTTKKPDLLMLHYKIKLLSCTGFLDNEDGVFSPYLSEQVRHHDRLHERNQNQMRSLVDSMLKEVSLK